VLIDFDGHGELDRLYNDGWWIRFNATTGESITCLDNCNGQVKNVM
jgi:hypothetical protein